MIQRQKIKVLIVEDSLAVRELLAHVISIDPRLEVVASLDSVEAALEYLAHGAADVISMDIHLPGMNGIEGTRRIMETRPTPIIIVSVTTRAKDSAFTMEALRAGALSVVEKPVGALHKDHEAMVERLCTHLAMMSQVKVVRQRFIEPSHGPASVEFVPALPASLHVRCPTCIGIVASTGGPKAVSIILNALGPGFPVPILLVQHMTPAFLEPFVNWLDQTTPFQVQLAEDGVVPLGGHVYHAPVDHHLRLHHGVLSIVKSSSFASIHHPSGDVLLDSIAADAGVSGVGIVLTGMGADGASGLAAMRAAGAYTIAEDRSSAVVYGMPMAACERGAVLESLSLDLIAPRLLSLVASSQKTGT